jgi:poly(3-hydroxybutyrate) depolymerase
MLYQIYETQRSLMEPFADFAQAASKMFSNPLSPLGQSPLSQRMSAAYDLAYRLGKDYERPVFGIKTVPVGDKEVAIFERVEIDKPFCELRRFKRFSDDASTLNQLKVQPAVLIVAPLSGHYSTLLRDTVRTMLRDHKVYITDWKNARLVPLSAGEFHLDDYVNYVQEFIRHLQSIYGNCHVVSVCQPTVPVLAAVSLMASRGETTPVSMTMMGGPIDARRSPTAVNNLATQRSFEWFENNVIYRVPGNFPGAGRRVYPGFMQHTGFVAMNPDRHATSHYDYFQDLIKGDNSSAEAHRQFYDEYNAVLDMDADYYLETINTVFQEFKLVNGTWDVKAPNGTPERVKPADIRGTALMTVEGELDDISGSGQTRAAQDMCSGIPADSKTHLEVEGAGHYGIFSGRRWRDTVYPTVRAFIASHGGGVLRDPQALAPAAVVQALLEPTPAAPAASAVPLAASTTVQKAPAKATAPAPRRAKAAPKTAAVATPPTSPTTTTTSPKTVMAPLALPAASAVPAAPAAAATAPLAVAVPATSAVAAAAATPLAVAKSKPQPAAVTPTGTGTPPPVATNTAPALSASASVTSGNSNSKALPVLATAEASPAATAAKPVVKAAQAAVKPAKGSAAR